MQTYTALIILLNFKHQRLRILTGCADYTEEHC